MFLIMKLITLHVFGRQEGKYTPKSWYPGKATLTISLHFFSVISYASDFQSYNSDV